MGSEGRLVVGRNFTISQKAFTAGEMSERIFGRSDFDQYPLGLSRCNNFSVTVHGPLVKRPGLQHVDGPVDAVRLIPFSVSRGDSYIVALGGGLAKFYRAGAYVASADIAIPYTDEQILLLDHVQSIDALFLASPDRYPSEIRRIGVDLFEFRESPSTPPYSGSSEVFGVLQNGAFLKVEVAGPSGKITSSAPIFQAEHVGTRIRLFVEERWRDYKIDTFTSATEVEGFRVGDFTDIPGAGPPVRFSSSVNIFTDDSEKVSLKSSASLVVDVKKAKNLLNFVEGKYVKVGGAAGNIITVKYEDVDSRVTPSYFDVYEVELDNGAFDPLHVGETFTAVIRGDLSFDYEITSVISETKVRVSPTGYTGAAASGGNVPSVDVQEWQTGLWNSIQGYPRAVALHRQRLFYASTSDQPQNVWGSRSADFNNFSTTDVDNNVLDDSGIDIAIDSDFADAVQWMTSAPRGLMVGTANGEYLIRAASGAPLSPLSVDVRREGTRGSRIGVKPVQAGDAIVYAHRSGRRIYSLSYDFRLDGYVGSDVTLLAGHVANGIVNEVALMQEPDREIVAAMENGELWVCAYTPEQNVTGWHQYTIGGEGLALSVAVALDDDFDRLHVLVERNGVKTIERLGLRQAHNGGIDHGPCVDGWFSYQGAPETVLTGLDVLDGHEVYVLDRTGYPSVTKFMGPFEVSGGEITLPVEVEDVVVGLPYTAEAVTLPINPVTIGFDASAALKAAFRIHGHVLGAMDLSGAQDGCKLYPVVAPEVAGEWSCAEAVSDMVDIASENTATQAIMVRLESSLPVFSTITALHYGLSIAGNQ